MSRLNKIMSSDEFQLGQSEIIYAYLNDLNIRQFSESDIYNKGDLICKIINNKVCIYRCIKNNTTGIFNESNWEVYTLNTRLEEELRIDDRRRIVEDIGGIKAFTDINGMSVIDVLKNLVFKKSPIKILSPRDVFYNVNNPEVIFVSEFTYKETSDPIELVEVIYNNEVVAYSNKPEDTLYIECNINNIRHFTKYEVKYRVTFKNDRFVETGVAYNIHLVYPTYVGVSENPHDPLEGLEPKLLKPNSSISIVKNTATLGAPTVYVQVEQWNDLYSCVMNDHLDLTNSLFFESVYVDGFLYNKISAHPTMCYTNTYTFNFNKE